MLFEASLFSLINVGVGFVISLVITYYLLPLIGYTQKRRIKAAFFVTGIYTVAAILRNIVIYWVFAHGQA